MTHSWDPARYLSYADERGRPFVELLARVPASAPGQVVDLGCGPGNLTSLLADRWPAAEITGVDASPEMIAATSDSRIEFRVEDLRQWAATNSTSATVDVLVSNATLQWVPDHVDLLPALVASIVPGGWLAFQVPGNLAEPSHTIRRELAAEPPYAPHAEGVATPDAHDAATYLSALHALGCAVDAWETTYLHVLRGEDPVFDWVSGTGARPTLQALPDDLRPGFEEEFRRRLRVAYPDRGHGVVLPFRRVFVVARTPGPENRTAERPERTRGAWNAAPAAPRPQEGGRRSLLRCARRRRHPLPKVGDGTAQRCSTTTTARASVISREKPTSSGLEPGRDVRDGAEIITHE